MVNETQSFSQHKDKAHSLATESIQRVIGQEMYKPQQVQTWVDTIGQDIVNRLRVCSPSSCILIPTGFIFRVQVYCVCYNCREEGWACAVIDLLLGRFGGLSCNGQMGESTFALRRRIVCRRSVRGIKLHSII
jgi:hypothetical protein